MKLVRCAVKASRRSFCTTQRDTNDEIVKYLKDKFAIHTLEDWYDVPKYYLEHWGNSESRRAGLRCSTMRQLVEELIPDHNWDPSKFTNAHSKQSQQKYMERIVRSMFPDASMQRNVRDPSLGLIAKSGKPLEMDLFLPDLGLAFEFQESHHYFESHFGTNSLRDYQDKDEEKRLQIAAKGITLITIPFWWGFDKQRLIASVKAVRPDLLTNETTDATPISHEIPGWVMAKFNKVIPGLGVPLLASPMLKSSGFDPKNWLVFEKFDGLRAIWHPEDLVFYSRLGNKFATPEDIERSMPQSWLDGEFWFGLGTLREAMKVSGRAALESIDWASFRYKAFDVPNHPGNYLERYETLKKVVQGAGKHPYIDLATYVVCKGKDHAEQEFTRITRAGGEGIILRNPNSAYLHGYTKDLLKYKGFKDDEAVIQAKISDTLFQLKMPSRREGAQEEHYLMEVQLDESFAKQSEAKELAVGDVVTYKYAGYSRHVWRPIMPKIYAVRTDMTWDDIINKPPIPVSSSVIRPIWKPPPVTLDNFEARRAYFMDIAKKKKFNPALAENWYQLDVKLAKRFKRNYKMFIEKLVAAFPEIEFDNSKFVYQKSIKGAWNDEESQRKFVDRILKQRNLDPKNIQDVYTLSHTIIKRAGGSGLIAAHNNSFYQMMIDLYPELNLEYSGFARSFKWLRPESRKEFFEHYARSHKFDPKNVTEWYKTHRKKILQTKGGKAVLSWHEGSYTKAMMDLFPELNFDPEYFQPETVSIWKDPKKRRDFFCKFAQKIGISSSSAEDWYSVTLELVRSQRGAQSVLGHHQGSYRKALIELFPELKLQIGRFAGRTLSRRTGVPSKPIKLTI